MKQCFSRLVAVQMPPPSLWLTLSRLCRATLLIALLMLTCLQLVVAEDKDTSREFAALKARYITLRNTDPEIERETEWKSLSKDFRSWALKKEGSFEGANSLFHSALLDFERFKVLKDSDAAEEAEESLQLIGATAPACTIADDALLKLGDLLTARGERRRAKRVYEELRDKYPESELSAVAAARLSTSSRVAQKKDENIGDNDLASSNQPRIVIDAGHGGEDLGAQGVGGLLEKDVTLSVALELAEILGRTVQASVKLTRKQDMFVPLAERTAMANDFAADLFISLHANASPTGRLTGLESYILDNSGDKSSKLLAERENASLQFESQESDLQFMLSDLVQSSKLNESKMLADEIQGSILSSLGNGFTRPKNLGIKKAPFYVLVGAHMPSVLVELAFIDNSQEGKSLADKGYRKALAQGIAEGVSSYLKRVGK